MSGRFVDQGATRTLVAADVVGRDHELAVLREALDAATGATGGVAFLVGEAGIGKSRLAGEIASLAAARGLPVLRGRAIHAAPLAAYRPLAEALAGALRTGVAPTEGELGAFAGPLGRLIPEWRHEPVGLAHHGQLGLAEAVVRFLRATAKERAAVVVLEDLQWADPETLQVVEYLTDNLSSERVLCLATVRDERSPGVELVRSVEVGRRGLVLRLAPLAGEEVAAMVASCLRSPVVSEDVLALVARGEGVPFMVEELLATARSAGTLVFDGASWRPTKPADDLVPPTLTEAMRQRVEVLGVSCRRVLEAAAVLGRQFDWSLLPAITGLDDRDVLAALHDAVDAQIAVFDPDAQSFRFRHALSRDTVLARLFPPERRALSRRALDALDTARPTLDERSAELAAELAEAAGDRRRAAILLVQGAHQAAGHGALASAETMLEHARALCPRSDPIRLDAEEVLLDVLALAGKRDQAVEVGASLLTLLAHDGAASQRRAGVHVRLARAEIAATRWDDADDHLEQAARELAASPEPELSVRMDVLRAQTAVVREPAAASGFARAALDVAERLGLPEVACEALEVLGRTQRSGDIDAAEATFTRALALAEANALTVWRARALQELGAIDMLRGRPVHRLEQARELALRLGALHTAAVVDVQVAAALVISDDPAAGGAAAHRAAELARRYHFDQTAAAAVALHAYVHARGRRPGDLRRCIDEARALAAGVPDIEVKTATASALLCLVQEDRRLARRHLCGGLKAAARGGDYVTVPAVGLLGLLRALDGVDDEAPEIVIPADSGHFLAAAFLRYGAAGAAGAVGDEARAVALKTEADGMLERHTWFAHLGRRLLAEAALTHGWGRPVDWLREALTFFDEGGDEPIASACRSLLRRAGVRVPRRRDTSGLPAELRDLGVTAREFEVLQLLASGLPNREIGARLYLSPRTVERHVANLTTKTRTRRRSELVAYAARTIAAAP